MKAVTLNDEELAKVGACIICPFLNENTFYCEKENKYVLELTYCPREVSNDSR